jgi:hypothetical protein
MTIYQIMNEQNRPIYAFLTLQNATQEVEMLNESQEDHYFYVEAVEFEDK